MSQQSAVYPDKLAQRCASALWTLLSSAKHSEPGLCLFAKDLVSILHKPRFGPPSAIQDGGGISRVPDWNSPPPGVKDIFPELRACLH